MSVYVCVCVRMCPYVCVPVFPFPHPTMLNETEYLMNAETTTPHT